MCGGLHALTLVAAEHIAFDEGAHTGPPIVAGDEFKSCITSGMTCGGRVMTGLDNLRAEV